jgi:ABC-type Mn2+/Zn2+ transport system permease subunit
MKEQSNSIFNPERKQEGIYAFNSKEFKLALGVVIATLLFQFTGIDIEHSLLDNIADIDWEKWDTALIATVFGVIRYLFTKDKIIGIFKK